MQNFVKEILAQINEIKINAEKRKESAAFRANALKNTNNTLIKNAFDTRFINQETDFISRRGLQNYNRSEQFISEGVSFKLKLFKKLKECLDDIYDQYGKEPEWQDSYCRILKNTLDKALRVDQNDQEFSTTQPSVGNLEYITELLYVRYRIDINLLKEKNKEDIKSIILKKDEELIKTNAKQSKVTKHDVSNNSHYDFLEKLLSGLKADKDNKSVQRSITITVKDEYLD